MIWKSTMEIFGFGRFRFVLLISGIFICVMYFFIGGEPERNKAEKECSLQGIHNCYAQCCEDHWIYERYFANPPLCQGVYVEIGAWDGIQITNTKFFEDALGWTGLLIEGNPTSFKRLQRNRPNSTTKHFAVCPEGVKSVNFTIKPSGLGGAIAYLPEKHIKRFRVQIDNTVEVPCMPMGKILREAGISNIDFFSLDVEGSEMIVLKTMDWNIPVKVFLIEHDLVGLSTLSEYLKGKGFSQYKRNADEGCSVNAVFERNDLFKNRLEPEVKGDQEISTSSTSSEKYNI